MGIECTKNCQKLKCSMGFILFGVLYEVWGFRVRYPIHKVPKEWKKAPVWLMLHSKQYPRCKAKVLVAFELVPAELVENDTYPFFDDIRPSTKQATVSIFLVGVRLFSPVQKPYVEVCQCVSTFAHVHIGTSTWIICRVS